MAATSGTAISLSESFYLRSFYKTNKDAAVSSKRKELSNSKLSQADAEALRQGVRKLRDFDLSDKTEDGANIFSSVSAFLETYNNALSSCSKSGDYKMQRYAKQLKSLAKEYADELKDIGISINSDGTLKKNENLLKSADVSDIRDLFSKDADFANKVFRQAKHISSTASDLIYTELTNKGGIINLQL